MKSMTATIQQVSLEAAFDVVASLKEKTESNPASNQVFKGIHPALGAIYVVILSYGGALILPIAIHSC